MTDTGQGNDVPREDEAVLCEWCRLRPAITVRPDRTGLCAACDRVVCPDCGGEGSYTVNPQGWGPTRDPQLDEDVRCGRCLGTGEMLDALEFEEGPHA